MTAVTIVFADLAGSTGMFESLGNTQAAQLVSKTTHWIGTLCTQRHGKVIKYLGDGVLMSFVDNVAAVQAAIDIQRLHREQISPLSNRLPVQIKIGLARGDVIEQDGDCFGDAVNVASRLSDLSGADQIFVTREVIKGTSKHPEIRTRHLGSMNIRGKSEAISVYRIEWQGEESSEFLTMQASLDSRMHPGMTLPLSIELTLNDLNLTFNLEDLPIFLGRVSDAQFVVNNPRVSRLHAKIDLRGYVFVLEDLSSFGTWVRFSGNDAVIALRRQECILLDQGALALGASFEDHNVPVVSYRIHSHMQAIAAPAAAPA
jgi:adenylate cyclase